MEMRDIKFPKPKRTSAKERKLNVRARAFAADRHDVLTSPPPPGPGRPRFSRAPFFIVIIVVALALGALGWRGFALSRSFYRFKSFAGSAAKQAPAEQPSLSKLLTLLQGGAGAVSGARDVSLSGGKLIEIFDAFRTALPEFIAGKENNLISILSAAKDELSQFKSALDRLAAADPKIKDQLPFVSSYATLDAQLIQGQALLEALLPWMQASEPHHLIVVFANTSELRPGGGFMGSFADLTIASGTMKDVVVHDINDVDATRSAQVIPPKPLQAIAGRWRTADANWFFDYPTSARKTLEFMSQSDLYATTTLDGIITITPAVVKDILTLTGPVTLPDGTVVSAQTFQDQIQKEVQAGQAAGNAAPKAILGELTPLLEDKLSQLNSDDEGKLVQALGAWVRKKDLMIFMRDAGLERAATAYQVDGSLYALPPRFTGDYLAVVDANIGGGKTDRFIKQEVFWDGHIDLDGTLHDTVTVTRAHEAASTNDWWYTLANWNYLQIFTPNGVTPEETSGGGHRDITPRADYTRGFAVDPNVAAIEKTMIVSPDRNLEVARQSDRNVFGSWQKLQPGEVKEFLISYERKLPAPPADGQKMDFVFESQSGASSSLTMKLTAPAGFVWQQTGGAIYEYRDGDPPGRVTIGLTLQRSGS